METAGMSRKGAQFRNEWRINRQPANPGSPEKMAVKTMCVCSQMQTYDHNVNL